MSRLRSLWPLPYVCSQAEPVRVAALFHYLIGKGFPLFVWITDTSSFGRLLDFISRYTLDLDLRLRIAVICVLCQAGYEQIYL